MSNVPSLTYPRTGKRGVPQQFPRRLYEMLECEAEKNASKSADDDTAIIAWSDSGKAFRIVDVHLFATKILSRYFRTNKFSSFQRNLNLYGFSKVRRGPDSDMYAHPSFIRGQPDLLMLLRKCTSTVKQRLSDTSANDKNANVRSKVVNPAFRSVSPSPPRQEVTSVFSQRSPIHKSPNKLDLVHSRQSYQERIQSPEQSVVSSKHQGLLPMTAAGVGKLDLLALAIEHAS